MTSRIGRAACAAALAAAVAAPGANAPHVYAIQGARIVTAAGEPIASGTIVVRDGLIAEVGAAVRPPAAAVVIDGGGLTVYPGLVDMGTSTGIEAPAAQPPQFRTTDEAERWKRARIFRPDLLAADRLRADAPELSRLASAGITTVLAVPPGQVVKGQSALVNVAGPPDEPQIGDVGDYRQGLQVVRTPVALHVELAGAPGDGYPVSLLGAIAFVRQSFLDAQHRQLVTDRYAKAPAGMVRPNHDPALDALQPALAGRLPVAFQANLSREILRALEMARQFGLRPLITGGLEADQVAADLAARKAPVIFSLDLPVRPRSLAPDEDEPARVLRARARAPRVPAALHGAGVRFAFSSSGLAERGDFLRNAGRTVKEGLPPDAALRALTIDAAAIAGAADRLGSLERGKIANLLVTDGDLFEERTRIRHVFVDGRPVPVDEPQESRGRGASSGY